MDKRHRYMPGIVCVFGRYDPTAYQVIGQSDNLWVELKHAAVDFLQCCQQLLALGWRSRHDLIEHDL